SRRADGGSHGSSRRVWSSSTFPSRSRMRRIVIGSIRRPLRANTENARVTSSLFAHDDPSASAEQKSFAQSRSPGLGGGEISGETMPSLCAQFSTSRLPFGDRIWKISTDGGFFDQTNARSSDTRTS